MRHSAWLLLALIFVVPVRGDDDPARQLARQVAEAAGLRAWGDVGTVSFTFNFAPKDLRRSYVWRVREGKVDVIDGDKRTTVDVAGPPPNARVTPEYVAAHKHFVNDSFWAFPCLHLVWDTGTTVTDLGEVDVPTLPDLGKRRALSLAYAKESGGYTPGDRYVFYLGEDHYPVAWAFHPQGAEQPRFVAEWRRPQDLGGVKVVEQYWANGGMLDLRIQDVAIAPDESGTAAPTSRPTSRPASPAPPASPPASKPAGR